VVTAGRVVGLAGSSTNEGDPAQCVTDHHRLEESTDSSQDATERAQPALNDTTGGVFEPMPKRATVRLMCAKLAIVVRWNTIPPRRVARSQGCSSPVDAEPAR